MQLKIQETTPKAIKKTPKKVKGKETPLKKGDVSVTPKATANTPKSVKKTPKPNSNGTPKEVKDQQKKTQNNKKPVQEKGNKTPQSEPITPKTPESGSKKKQKPRHRSMKKQKLEDGESKEIITDLAGKQNEKDALQSDKSTPITSMPLISVSPPCGIAIPSEIVQQIFEGSEHVIFSRFNSFLIKYKQDVVSKKMKELQNIKFNGGPLHVRENIRNHNLLKRTVRLMNADDQEKVQKFYNAKSIENIISRFGAPTKIYILAFETEKEAASASEKKFNLGDQTLTLLPYYQNNKNDEKKPSGDGKVSKKQVQKQGLNKTKQSKNAQVESKKQEQKQKLNVSKQSKNAQVKRKAEEDEEEEEEEEEEEFDFDGEIDMGDDDDDDEDDDDDDDGDE